jgi:hypothetical protein
VSRRKSPKPIDLASQLAAPIDAPRHAQESLVLRTFGQESDRVNPLIPVETPQGRVHHTTYVRGKRKMKHWKLGSLVAISCGFLVWSCGSDDEGSTGAGATGGSAGKGGSTQGGSGGKGGSAQGGSVGKGGSAGSNTAGSAGSSVAGQGQGGEAGSSLGGQGGEPAAAGGAAGATGTAGAGGAEACVGTATACDQLSNAQCAMANGCTVDGTCSGTPDVCGDQDMAGPCGQIMGCTWDGDSCEGTADACDTHNGSVPCEGAGCTWTACSGTAATCASLTLFECAMQPGCSVQ